MKIVLLDPLAVSEKYYQPQVASWQREGHQVAVYDQALSDSERLEAARSADVLLIGQRPLSQAFLTACEHLKMISVAFTGVDHVPMELCRERGILVANAAGYATEAVAELTLGLMIQGLRSLPEAQEATKHGGTKAGLRQRSLAGRKVGIVGVGAIGREVARLLKAFGATSLSYQRPGRAEIAEIDAYLPWEAFLAASEILTLHCPLTAESKHLIDAKALALLPHGALLINTARGQVVDEDAVLQALQSGHLGAYLTDVYATEPPLDPQSPLLRHERVYATPHLGFATEEALVLRCHLALDNIEAFLHGEKLQRICS